MDDEEDDVDDEPEVEEVEAAGVEEDEPERLSVR